MAFKAKEIILHIRRGLVFSTRIIYRSVCKHPLVWAMMFFLVILYRYLPSLFGFVVFSSPIVVCTALLLGTLLLYADANIPGTEEKQNVEGYQNLGTGDNNVFSEDEDFSTETHVARKAAHLGEGEGLQAKPGQSGHFVSIGSPWQPMDDHDASSGSESDHAENSSPDASVSDILPTLDELHPLLDLDAPQTALRYTDNSDAASSVTSQDQESDDGSIGEETENQEDEESEAPEEKDDANEVVFKWTADDQKNLMDLGTSEMERNQRLENLIAKRRARKFLSFHADKNLIDFESDDPVPSMEDRARFNFQISSISVPRRNPFDIPFKEETIMGLPPIPGSAPPVLQPRRNPFDIPYDPGEENSRLAGVTMHQQEFVPSPRRDMFFQRHESFTIGASSSGDIKQEAHGSILKPYFVPESTDSEGPGFVPFQMESSKKGDSKVSSSHESDTTSSDMDQEDHNELVEAEEPESHLLSLANHYVEPVEGDNQSSDEVDSVGSSREQIGVDEISLLTHQTADAFSAVEMEIRQGEYSSPDSDAGKIEVIEERYDDSSSSSSEAYENHSKMSHESDNPEQERDSSLPYPVDSTQSVSADSDLNRATEKVDDSQVADPVYDSSPSAVEKSLSNSPTTEDDLLFEGKMNSSEEVSSRRPHDSKVSSEETFLESDSEGIWVAPSSLSFVDENESRSREINEIRELDVIQVGETSEDFNHPVSPVLPKFVLPSHLLVGPSENAFAGDAMINNGSSSNSPFSGKPLTPRDVPTVLQSERAADLPPILEEHSECYQMEDENDSAIDQTAASSDLTGMHLVEEHN